MRSFGLLLFAGWALALPAVAQTPAKPGVLPTDIPTTPRVAPADEAFMRQMDAQREALRERGAAGVELPVKPPAPKTTAQPKAKPAPAARKAPPPEPAPTIDEDLAAIAATEGMIQPGAGDPPEEKLPTKTVVFVSLSMPDTTLKTLFAQGLGRDDVLFVFRGWKPPNFVAMGQKVKQLMNEAGGFEINVVIDPYPFRNYKVKQVPVFLHQRTGGDWRRVTGEISLDRAIDEIERGNFNRTLGTTYKVAEPDIVEEIQKQAEKFDWEKEKAKMAERAMTNMDGGKPLIELPRVEETREFFVDPSVELAEDVLAPNGQVVARKGDSINPFSTMSFSKSFIAFDPDDPKQVLLARRWQQEYGPVMLLATHLPSPVKGVPPLAETMGQSVFPLSPQLIERMGIAAVPSLIRQQGLLLRINEQKP